MASKTKAKGIAKSTDKEKVKGSGARRSQRSCKSKFHDSYFVGHEEIDKYIGIESDEDSGTRRFRKKYFRDDGSDYEDNYRHGRKRQRGFTSGKRDQPRNPIEGLLRWRYELNPVVQPTKDNSKLIKVKSISKEPLDKHAHGVQAIFINIDWDQKGQTLEDLKNLKIESRRLMDKGLVFIWTPAHHMTEIVDIMQSKQFTYVENLEIGLLDRKKAEKFYREKYGIPTPKIQKQVQKNGKKKPKLIKDKNRSEEDKVMSETQFTLEQIVSSLEDCNPGDFMLEMPSKYFNKSKKTLFFFRKISQGKIELRHQRTCDAVFDMPKDPKIKCQAQLKGYIYDMIETLLPKCIRTNVNQLNMVELWGDQTSMRRGWITISEN